MRKYGYTSSHNKEIVTFAAKTGNMRHESKIKEESAFEILQLQKRVSELEQQLSASELKGLAWHTMVKLAEKEFNISIKKGYC